MIKKQLGLIFEQKTCIDDIEYNFFLFLCLKVGKSSMTFDPEFEELVSRDVLQFSSKYLHAPQTVWQRLYTDLLESYSAPKVKVPSKKEKRSFESRPLKGVTKKPKPSSKRLSPKLTDGDVIMVIIILSS